MALRLAVFEQTCETAPSSLGRWRLMEVDVPQLARALEFRYATRDPAASRFYSAEGAALRRVTLPALHALRWNADLAGQERLTHERATERLTNGEAVQVFVYDPDADCVAHFLVVPLGEPVCWWPDAD